MKLCRFPSCILGAAAALSLAACVGDGSNSSDAALGGSVTGLSAGSTVTLADNDGTTLAVTGSGAFEFPVVLAPDSGYAVAVAVQPPGSTCVVANGSGTVDANADPVQNVDVSCTPGVSVAGTLSGLAAGASVTLSDAGGPLPLSANGSFGFGDLYAIGAAYAVSVTSQPAGQVCSVSNGSGSIDANGDAVTNVVVSCATASTVGGTVAGLAANQTLTLGDGSSTLPVSADGSFVFADNFAPLAPYQVSVVAQPGGQSCVVNNAGGQFDSNGDPVNNVAVTCSTNGTVGGTLSGLNAGAIVTLSDGTSSTVLTVGGSFAFADLFAAGAAYGVTVTGQPAGQTCTVSNGSGTLDANDDAVTTVTVSCS
jgi:hypothetical protein